MAGGSSKAIADIELGEQVVATDPETGETEPKPVTALHINQDTDLADVTVTIHNGSAKSEQVTLKTTQHHPFWDNTEGRWVDAADLQPRHELLVHQDIFDDTKQPLDSDNTGAGQGGGGPPAKAAAKVTVTAVHNHVGSKTMHDLTIADTHTYYVIAGNTPVLVHNCGGALSNAYNRVKWLLNIPRVLRNNRALANSLDGVPPEPNATVRDLLDFKPGNAQRSGKLVNASARSDEDLLNSVFNPSDNQFIATTPSMPNTIFQGNHRVYQLLQRAADPDNLNITYDTPIFINRGDW